jgi:hypothetical protein
VDLDAKALELIFGFPGQILRVGGQNPRAALEQQDPGTRGADGAELASTWCEISARVPHSTPVEAPTTTKFKEFRGAVRGLAFG